MVAIPRTIRAAISFSAIFLMDSFGKAGGFIQTGRAWSYSLTKFNEAVNADGTFSPQITLCWKSNDASIIARNNLEYNFSAIRATTEEIARLTWETYSGVRFRWETKYDIARCDVEIDFNPPAGHLGSVPESGIYSNRMSLNIDWMVPIRESDWRPANETPATWWNSSSTTMLKRTQVQYSFLREIVIHELGHILGFEHEQERPSHTGKSSEYPTAKEVGRYDVFSIMNYEWIANPNLENAVQKLSCGDVASARVMYGFNPSMPNLAPKCTELMVSTAAPDLLGYEKITDWVGDVNLNTRHLTFPGALPNSGSGSGGGGGGGGGSGTTRETTLADHNLKVTVVPSNQTTPGYNITISLIDPNGPGATCQVPKKIAYLKAHPLEMPTESDIQGGSCPTPGKCLEYHFSDIELSSCKPSKTVWVPAGIFHKPGTNYYVYQDCEWEGESAIGYLGERISFGLIGNGDYSCIERDGVFTKISTHSPFGAKHGEFELPFTPERMMKFFPSLWSTPKQPSSHVVLRSQGKLKRFFVDKHEVTQGSYYEIMAKLPFYFAGYGARPAENVTWYDAILYCNRRSLREGLQPVYSWSSATYSSNGTWCLGLSNLKMDQSKNGYRLLSEEEWRQAYSAKTTTQYYWGSSVSPGVSNNAWYVDNSNGKTQMVGHKAPNPWNLYDMGGNVEEWLWEFPSDPNLRNTIGGSYYNPATYMGPHKAYNNPATRKNHIGFRVIRNAANLEPILGLLLN